MRVHIKLTTKTTTTTTDYTVPPKKKKKKYIERNIFRFISLSNLLTIIVPRPVPRTLHPMAPEFDYLQIVTNNI